MPNDNNINRLTDEAIKIWENSVKNSANSISDIVSQLSKATISTIQGLEKVVLDKEKELKSAVKDEADRRRTSADLIDKLEKDRIDNEIKLNTVRKAQETTRTKNQDRLDSN